MLGPSFFDNDPFFANHRDRMLQMEQMFPFGGGMNSMMALPGGSQQVQQRQRAQNMQVADRGLVMDPFAHFNSMFSNMHHMMSDMRRAFHNVDDTHGGNVFQQSSIMTFSNTGNGAPQYYQATSSSRRGPSGVCETQKTERDSASGVDKIAVGHHIRDRGHVIERSRNNKTGEMNENQDYINIDEEEAQHFDQEYRDKWQSSMRGIGHGREHGERSRHVAGPARSRYAALPEPDRRRHHHHRSTNRRE